MFDKRRVFLSEIMNTNSLDCIVSKVKIAKVSPNVRWSNTSGCIDSVLYRYINVSLFLLFDVLIGLLSLIWKQKRNWYQNVSCIMTWSTCFPIWHFQPLMMVFPLNNFFLRDLPGTYCSTTYLLALYTFDSFRRWTWTRKWSSYF